MPDVFISYARSTAAQAERVAAALRELGYSVWRDDALQPHRAYTDEIRAQLDAARAVVVIWSYDGVRSEWVRSEADRARSGRKLVQLTIDGSPLPMPFEQIQCADLTGWSGNVDTPAWRSIVASIASLTGRGQAEAAESRRPVEPVLAVLPFDNLSSDPEMQFFSDGVSEELIRQLSRGSRLKVVGRTSSFQFRAERKAAAVAALHCSHVLDGSIRRAGGRIRLSAYLVDAASGTTLWSDRYDGSLEDVFSVQDDISASIAAALDQTFASSSPQAVGPADYDLYLRASPASFAPAELRTNIGLLEVATSRAPHFTAAWARLAYLRAWLRFYEPYANRVASAAQSRSEAQRALADDPADIDALAAQLFVLPPFGAFLETDAAVARLLEAPGTAESKKYVGWFMRQFGHVRASVAEDERAYQIDRLDPMAANLMGLALLAVGRLDDAMPVFEDLVGRVPDMSFPLSSLLRAKAFVGDWPAVDDLLELAARRQLREFQDGLAFIRAKRDPTRENVDRWWSDFESHVRGTGCVDASRLVYAAHLGLVDEAYVAAEHCRLGPAGAGSDIMGPDAYRTSIMFQANMPELRNDPRFIPLCVRLGLVEFWTTTGSWPDCADEVPYDFRAECERQRHLPKDDFGF